jgi:hypothetical protein
MTNWNEFGSKLTDLEDMADAATTYAARILAAVRAQPENPESLALQERLEGIGENLEGASARIVDALKMWRE